MYPAYNPYGMMQMPNPYQPPRPSLPQQQQIITVAGEDSFKTMQTAPNTSFLALDQNQAILYVCQSDGVGKVTPTLYDIFPHKSPEQVAQANIETQLSQFSERLRKVEEAVNGKPNSSEPI